MANKMEINKMGINKMGTGGTPDMGGNESLAIR
jgi:hypothetical protein